MENMCTVLMDIYSVNLLTIDISSGVWSLVNDKTTFSPLVGKVCKSGTEKPGTDYKVIVFHENYIRFVFQLIPVFTTFAGTPEITEFEGDSNPVIIAPVATTESAPIQDPFNIVAPYPIQQ